MLYNYVSSYVFPISSYAGHSFLTLNLPNYPNFHDLLFRYNYCKEQLIPYLKKLGFNPTKVNILLIYDKLLASSLISCQSFKVILYHTWNRSFSAWPLCLFALLRRVLYPFPPPPFSAEQMTLFGRVMTLQTWSF